MKKIEVLVVVDSVGALASGSLVNNVYVVDTNKFLGSWNEGQCDLHTLSQDQQSIRWSVVAISPDSEVAISSFDGDMLTKKVCVPVKTGTGTDVSWQGQVETQGGFGRFAYILHLSVEGTAMSFSPYLEVQ
jgi:hypothetical protein